MYSFKIPLRIALSASLCAAILVSAACSQARQHPDHYPGAAEPSAASGPGKCPPYPDGRKADASPLVDGIDTNHDGKMTHEEWAAAGAPEPSWNMFMKKEKIKKQGYIAREDFLNDTPPNGIDTNCDGKITLEEFLATKSWNLHGPGGPPAP